MSVQRLNAMRHEISDEVRYRFLKFVADNPNATQRDVARALGVSLGKANYCLRALIETGFVKVRRFALSGRKVGYSYLLTRTGFQERTSACRAFLSRKVEEYNALVEEIGVLKNEVDGFPDDLNELTSIQERTPFT